MSSSHPLYIPCIRWKQGEYKALNFLSAETKKLIRPLIDIAEMGFDFETRETHKSIDKHLEKFAKRVKNKWGKQDRKSTRLNSSHIPLSRMPSSA